MPASPLAHHFFAMACNNAWANERLLTACTPLGDDGFAAARKSFFGSLARTANHVLTVDWFYVDALERTVRGQEPHPSPGVFFEPEHPFETLAPLADAQRAVDGRLIALTRSLDDTALGTVVRIRRRHGTSADTTTLILAHLFQHQIHHRGQIHGLLSAADITPPQLDEFFCRGDAPARVSWLKSVGLEEQDLFPEA